MRRARLLVVDDEPGMLRAVSRILGPRHEVTAVRSGREALAAAVAGYDLALVDVRMPDLNGFELTARLKQADPDIDVILMTGSVSEPDAKLVRALREDAFYFIHKPFDREVLETLVERCLERRQLHAENRRHLRRLLGELATARAFQQSLLPPVAARLGGVVIAGRCLPSTELGGDVFDYAESGLGVSVLVADVSGHGVAAAMLTGSVKASFREAHGRGPRAVIEQVARSLSSFGPQRFVTAFALLVPSGRDQLVYASAGHPAALLLAGNGVVRELGSTGLIASAALPAARWREETAAFAAGDRLLVYTDGLAEAGAGDEQLGPAGLAACLASAPAAATGAELLDRVFAAAAPAPGRSALDDQTAVVLGRC